MLSTSGLGDAFPRRGDRRRRVAYALLGAALFGTPAFTALPQAPPPPTLSFDRAWRAYQSAVSAGDPQLSERALARLKELRVERNVYGLQDIALAFSYQGAGHLDQGDLRRAEEEFRRAIALDPTLPLPHFGLARVARSSGGIGLLRYFGYTIEGWLATLGSLGTSHFARANLLGVTTLCLLLVAAIYGGILLYRYAVLLEHELAERLEERLGRPMVRALVVGLLLAPLMITLGFGWLPFFWVVLTFAYQSRAEKILSVVALVLLAALSPLAGFSGLWARTQVNPVFRAAMSSLYGSFDPADARVLEIAVAQSPEDLDLKRILAIQYKNLGDYDRAQSTYRAILAARRDDLDARINLGNIYFAIGDYDGAELEYRAALETHPRSALAFYNKSLAHAEKFQFREREEARASADRLDRTLRGSVAWLEIPAATLGSEASRRVADVKPDANELVAKFFGLEQGAHPRPVSVWNHALTEGGGLRLAVGAMVLAALLGLLHYGFPSRPQTMRCWKCGSPFCGRCQIGTGRRGLCTQCYHLFIVKDGVSAAARNQKHIAVQESARFKDKLFRILSLVAPGAGHLAEDRPLVGAVLLTIWVAGWILLLTGGGPYPLADDLMGLRSPQVGYLLVGVLLASALGVANLVAQPGSRA
jgi:tetratricopeptide (TPR) repeat protein